MAAGHSSGAKQMIHKIFGRKQKPLALDKINDSAILYDAEYLLYVRQYYLYCLELLEGALASSNAAVNIIFGSYRGSFPNKNKTYKVDIQFEHTLVKQGGRDTKNAMPGAIKAEDGSSYLVRIDKYKYYSSLDFIIEYSRPNIVNIGECGRFQTYLDRCSFISPLLYQFSGNSINKNRSRKIVTTFNNENEPRRRALLDKLKDTGLDFSNEKNRFSKEDVEALYADTRILVNIHQTPHHHTFEELRVLPALLCGCVIVSEDVPLKEHIPYSEFIIWSDYDSIVEKVKHVSDNYDFYFNEIFGKSALSDVIRKMESDNRNSAARIVANIDRYDKHQREAHPFAYYSRRACQNVIKHL
jgi:hypothetical protein